MKYLIFSILLLPVFMNTSEQSTGHQQIIERVAEAFNVSEAAVSLQSPDIVIVSEGYGTSYGVAEFTPCGEDCTQVEITFSTTTLNFIVEDEVEGV